MTLVGVASVSVFLSIPALALVNSNSSSVDGSLNNRTLSAESTGRSRQLLAQGASGTGGTGTGQTGTGGTGTGQTGTGEVGTCPISANGITSSNRQANRQQNAFTQHMNAGYAATQQRNYPTALVCFQRALQLRPGNPYAAQAVQNVQGYIQRANQGGTNAPINQGGTTTPINQGGTTAPTNQGGTAAPTNQGGTAAPTNQGGTTTPTNQSNP
ncbi:MAG: hypothetical protein Fur006_34400 [Coleofasciculaceae cyanobacterium]